MSGIIDPLRRRSRRRDLVTGEPLPDPDRFDGALVGLPDAPPPAEHPDDADLHPEHPDEDYAPGRACMRECVLCGTPFTTGIAHLFAFSPAGDPVCLDPDACRDRMLGTHTAAPTSPETPR